MEQLDIKSLYEDELKEKMVSLGENSCISGFIRKRWEVMRR